MKDYDIVLLQGEHVTVVIPSTASEYESCVLVGGVKYNPARSFKAVAAKKTRSLLTRRTLLRRRSLSPRLRFIGRPRKSATPPRICLTA